VTLSRLACGSLLVSLALPLGLRARNLSVATPVGDPIRGERIALSCSRCHGNHGTSSEAWIPSLAGLNREAIYKQLEDYRSHRRRPEWYMASIAQALSTQDSADVSAYYGAQVRPAARSTANSTSPRIAFCGTCHNARGGDIPQIAGQQQQYLEIQLSLFAQGIRSNDRDGVMRNIARKLTVDEIRQFSELLGPKSH
jgi:cytochrome c553